MSKNKTNGESTTDSVSTISPIKDIVENAQVAVADGKEIAGRKIGWKQKLLWFTDGVVLSFVGLLPAIVAWRVGKSKGILFWTCMGIIAGLAAAVLVGLVLAVIIVVTGNTMGLTEVAGV